MSWPPLAVCVGEGRFDCRLPQLLLVEPQLRVQLTPLAEVSFVTVAASSAVLFTPICAGGGVVMLIVIGVGTMESTVLAVMEGSLASAAVIVTLPPTGRYCGAL